MQNLCVLFIYNFLLHLSTHLSMCQTCFQRIIFMCKMYKPINEQTSHYFYYLFVTCYIYEVTYPKFTSFMGSFQIYAKYVI
jgi:hypothetical protein